MLNVKVNGDVYQVRLENLKALISVEGSAVRVADKLEIKPPYLSQIISRNSKRKMGSTLARRIETVFKLPQGWMDRDHHPETEEALQLARRILALPSSSRAALRALIDSLSDSNSL